MKESGFSIIKKERWINAMAILSTIFGVLFFFLSESKFFYDDVPSSVSILIPSGMVLTGAFIFLMNYLKNGNALGTSDQGSLLREELEMLQLEAEMHAKRSYASAKFEQDFEYLKIKVDSLSFDKALIGENEKENIIKRIEESIKKDVGHSLFKEIEEKFSADFKKERYLADLRKQCNITRVRLNDEIVALGRRGNVNLGIGVMTTIVAVSILASTVISGNSVLSGDALLSYYFPRFTLSVFIEIFSFFFLKLYKAGLSEIKYFQNELTNAELKFIGAEKAILLGNEESIRSVIEALSSTERNFKLNKGESTVELERVRNDSDSLNAVLNSVIKIVSAKK